MPGESAGRSGALNFPIGYAFPLSPAVCAGLRASSVFSSGSKKPPTEVQLYKTFFTALIIFKMPFFDKGSRFNATLLLIAITITIGTNTYLLNNPKLLYSHVPAQESVAVQLPLAITLSSMAAVLLHETTNLTQIITQTLVHPIYFPYPFGLALHAAR